MIVQPGYIKALLKKYLERTISPQETETLLATMDIYALEEFEQMFAETDPEMDRWYYKTNTPQPDYHKLKMCIQPIDAPLAMMRYRLIALCACLLLVMGCLLVGWFIQKPSEIKYACGPAGNEETPTDKYSCQLTLHSGCTVSIDSSYKGLVASEGNMDITKLQSGILVYNKVKDISGDGDEKMMTNTVTTARGAQYRVVLPDGTRVRLNAASSISYPVVFSGNSRNVQVTGEAFFEVAAIPGISFNAWVSNIAVTSRAGSFNVNAYAQDARVTLVKGDLEMLTALGNTELRPGEQAVVNGGNDIVVEVNGADTNTIVSWKKYRRIYIHIAWRDLVADIGRRYDLDMINTSSIKHGFFSGDFCYDMPVEEVLNLLSDHTFHFKKQGRKIIFIATG